MTGTEGAMRARQRHAGPGPAGGRRHRHHRRDDRRRRHARRHEPACASCRAPSTRTSGRAPTARCTGCGPSSARRRPGRARSRRGRRARSPASTSSGRSTAPSTCRPTSPRSGAWSRASAARSTWCSRSARTSRTCRKLADADVNVCMYREFGRKLCEALEQALPAGADRPAFAPPTSCASSASCSASTPSRSSSARSTPRSSRSGTCGASVTQDFFATASFAIVATETYARGMRNFLEDEMGLPCAFAFARKAGVKPDNAEVREAMQRDAAAGAVRLATTSACTRPRPAARCDATSRPRSRARSSAAPPARRSWAMPAPPTSCRNLQRAVRRAVPHPAARHRIDRVEATPARLRARAARGTTMRSALLDALRRDASRSWSASRPPSGCATAPSAMRARAGEERVTASRVARSQRRAHRGRCRGCLATASGLPAWQARSRWPARANAAAPRRDEPASSGSSSSSSFVDLPDGGDGRAAAAVAVAVALGPTAQVDLRRGQGRGAHVRAVRVHGLSQRFSARRCRAEIVVARCRHGDPAARDMRGNGRKAITQEVCRWQQYGRPGRLPVGPDRAGGEGIPPHLHDELHRLLGGRGRRALPRLACGGRGCRARTATRSLLDGVTRRRPHVMRSSHRRKATCGESGCCSTRAGRWSPCSRSCSCWRW